MKILRITRHPAHPEQIGYLKAVYGVDLEIVERDIQVTSAHHVREEVIAAGADILETVLPFEMLAEVVPLMRGINVQVIRAKMVRDRELQTMTFGSYEIVERVVIQTRRLNPPVMASPATSHLH